MPDQYIDRVFIVYPVEIGKFIEYCKRFRVTEGLDIKYIPPTEIVVDNEVERTTGDFFLCHVHLDCELNVLRFINCFSLFFNVSKSIGQ